MHELVYFNLEYTLHNTFTIVVLLIFSDVRYRSDKNYKIGGHIRSKPKILLIKINSEVIFGHKKLEKFLTTVIQLIVKFLFNIIIKYIIISIVRLSEFKRVPFES